MKLDEKINEHCPFTRRQIRDFVRQTRERVGDGWAWIVDDVKEALLSQRALHALGGQATETIKTEWLHATEHAMCIEALQRHSLDARNSQVKSSI